MGVRISWLMFARNALLARVAASAASRAIGQLDRPQALDLDFLQRPLDLEPRELRRQPIMRRLLLQRPIGLGESLEQVQRGAVVPLGRVDIRRDLIRLAELAHLSGRLGITHAFVDVAPRLGDLRAGQAQSANAP